LAMRCKLRSILEPFNQSLRGNTKSRAKLETIAHLSLSRQDST
jgi:hypothetical protein